MSRETGGIRGSLTMKGISCCMKVFAFILKSGWDISHISVGERHDCTYSCKNFSGSNRLESKNL